MDLQIKDAIGGKVPHFFLYAKDKKPYQVERRNKSTVNRLYDITKVHKFDFQKKQLGTFDYKMLMCDPNVEVDLGLVETFRKMSSDIGSFNISKEGDTNKYISDISNIKTSLSFFGDDKYVCDVLVKQLFDIKKSKHKAAFWDCFGDIVLENLKQNINPNSVLCEECGKRFIPNAEQQKYCDDCSVYQPIETKTIICKDCGEEFEVDSKDNQTDRCANCYKDYRKNRKLETQKIRRSKNKLIEVSTI